MTLREENKHYCTALIKIHPPDLMLFAKEEYYIVYNIAHRFFEQSYKKMYPFVIV